MSVSASGPRESLVHPLSADPFRVRGHQRHRALPSQRLALLDDLAVCEFALGLGED